MWNFTFPVGLSAIKNLVFSKDGKYILAYTSKIVYFLNNSFSSSKLEMWSYQVNQINSADITANGMNILVGTGSPTTLYLINNKNETLWSNPLQEVQSVAISAEGDYFAVGANAPTYKIYLFHRFITSISSGGGGDDDDDDDEEAAIPFGNYYLIFACVAIISLILTMKKKKNFELK